VDALEVLRTLRQDESRDRAARVGELRAEVDRIGRKIERAGELRERRRSLDADAALLKTLADHLRANELVAWIQEEALGRLAEDGSHHLSLLSQGRYALRLGSGEATTGGGRAEQDFFVVDHWSADGVRSVKTLSGGETFLASLALALALAERRWRACSSTRASAPSTARASTRWSRPWTLCTADNGWWASSPTCGTSPSGCRPASRSGGPAAPRTPSSSEPARATSIARGRPRRSGGLSPWVHGRATAPVIAFTGATRPAHVPTRGSALHRS
jgi:hypothetical protein